MREVLTIQYLRGIAALLVLLYHACERFQVRLEAGAAGVDIFFVISGFIMWVTTNGRDQSPSLFMWRRIERIVPLYWIVTSATAAAISVKPAFLYGHDLTTTNLFASLLFVPEVRNGAFHPIVIQGWTLCYEMFFYIIFALSLLVRGRARASIILCALLAFVIVGMSINVQRVGAFFNSIILEFAGGILLALWWQSGWRPPLSLCVGAAVLGLATILLADWAVPDAPRVLRWGVPALLLVAGCIFAEKQMHVKEIKPLKLLGDASYSVYLWHVLLGAVVDGVALKLGAEPPVRAILVGGGSLVGSLFLFWSIERPLNARFHRARIQRKRLAVSTSIQQTGHDQGSSR